jgi:hypothetical protein
MLACILACGGPLLMHDIRGLTATFLCCQQIELSGSEAHKHRFATPRGDFLVGELQFKAHVASVLK